MMIRRGFVPGFILSGVLALGGTTAALAASDDDMAKAAKVPIAQAIEAAELKGGGKATEAEFEDDYGGRWEVKVLSAAGDRLTVYFVDPNSGQVTGEEEQTFEKYFTLLKPEAFQKAQVQLRDAIAAAETAAGGKAISAEVERSGDTVAYEIEVFGDTTKDVDVDANGKATVGG